MVADWQTEHDAEGCSQAEKVFVSAFVSGNALRFPRPRIEECSTCVLEVTQKYFATYDDVGDGLREESLTCLKAVAAAKRRCN
jgi:hypothetical protein